MFIITWSTDGKETVCTLFVLTGRQPVCRQQLAADNPNTDTIRTLFIAAIISVSS